MVGDDGCDVDDGNGGGYGPSDGSDSGDYAGDDGGALAEGEAARARPAPGAAPAKAHSAPIRAPERAKRVGGAWPGGFPARTGERTGGAWVTGVTPAAPQQSPRPPRGPYYLSPSRPATAPPPGAHAWKGNGAPEPPRMLRGARACVCRRSLDVGRAGTPPRGRSTSTGSPGARLQRAPRRAPHCPPLGGRRGWTENPDGSRFPPRLSGGSGAALGPELTRSRTGTALSHVSLERACVASRSVPRGWRRPRGGRVGALPLGWAALRGSVIPTGLGGGAVLVSPRRAALGVVGKFPTTWGTQADRGRATASWLGWPESTRSLAGQTRPGLYAAVTLNAHPLRQPRGPRTRGRLSKTAPWTWAAGPGDPTGATRAPRSLTRTPRLPAQPPRREPARCPWAAPRPRNASTAPTRGPEALRRAILGVNQPPT
nr:collagen alpha-1(II) chain [Oryctolagus cuniculus]